MSTITQFPSGNTQYRIGFDYLARTFVVVTLVNSSNPTLNRVLEVGRDYRFLSPTMIEMLVDQSGFDIVRIHRQTGTDLVVDFRNGSVLTAGDLTNAELQAIHIAEEGRDQTVDLAKEYADAAGSSAGNAKDSEDEARRIAERIKASGLIGYITRRSFEKGFNVTTWNEVLLWEEDGDYYRWDGTLPKNVPAGSTPETSGGVGPGAWVSVGDASLRSDLASDTGFTLIGGKGFVTPEDFGAKGDALLSIGPGGEYITNPNATDDTVAIRNAIESGATVRFNGSKGYLISDIFDNIKSGQTILGNGAKIVYRGGKPASSGIYRRIGVFQPTGTFDTYDVQAVAAKNANTLKEYIDVYGNDSLKLKRGDYFTLLCDNGVQEADYETHIKKYVFCMPRVSKITDNEDGTKRIWMSYKMGYTFTPGQITIGKANPLTDIHISGFVLIDEQVVTPTEFLPSGNAIQAPEAEREVAIGLFKAVCTANITVEDLTGYTIKWPLCSTMLSHSVSYNKLRVMSTDWSGGGEGYCVSMNWCTNFNVKDLILSQGRHVFDTTACSWGTVIGARSYEDNYGITSHTTCDHDITYIGCVARGAGFANGAFGKVTSRLSFIDCKFDRVAMEGAMYVTFTNCFLNDIDVSGGFISFVGCDVTELRWLRYDARSGTDEVVNRFAKAGTLTVDAGTRLLKSGTWYSSFALRGWTNVYIAGVIEAPAEDRNPVWNIDSVSRFKITGEMKNIQLLFQGTTQYIQVLGCKVRHTRSDITTGAVLGWGVGVPPGVQYVTIRDNHFQLSSGMQPYNIASNESNTSVLSMALSLGGNSQVGGAKGNVNDYNGSKLSFNGFLYTGEASAPALQPTISVASDAVRYKDGDVAPGVGVSGRPGMWNAATGTWITLN